MNTEMQSNYNDAINRMVNAVIGQNRLHQDELWRYPLCILYGDMPEQIVQIFRTELMLRIGNEHAIALASVPDRRDMKPVKDAVEVLQKSMEEGLIRQKDEFYIPIIFMADQVNAKELHDFVAILFEEVKKYGFCESYHDFHVCYYCILDFTMMDGNLCKEELLKVKKWNEADFPVGIFTQNHLSNSEYKKYLKAVQAITIHIFLQVSKDDKGMGVLEKRENSGQEIPYFTIGYWKLDVLKQKMADYMIRCIEMQSEKLMEYGKYIDRIRMLIDQMLDFDTERWVDAYMQMPVNIADVEACFHYGFFKHPKMSGEALMQSLYGDCDGYAKFIQDNIGCGDEAGFMDTFLQKDIGNLDAVSHDLKGVLDAIKRDYAAEREKLGREKNAGAASFLFTRNKTIGNILVYLKNNYWEWDSRNILLERKIKFVEALRTYVDTSAFQDKLAKLEEQNKKEISRLESIRREASMEESCIFYKGKTEMPFLQERGAIPLWNQAVFDSGMMCQMQEALQDAKEDIGRWMEENMVEIMSAYVKKIDDLKRNSKSYSYYAAKMKSSNPFTLEKEYIFIGEGNQSRERAVDKLQEIAGHLGRNASVVKRKWETGMCLELVAIKEIEDLSQIHGIG